MKIVRRSQALMMSVIQVIAVVSGNWDAKKAEVSLGV